MKIISFEGIEGVGKSTQIRLLKDFLESKNLNVEVLREPGSTLAGEKIRDILLDNDSKLSSETELLLMFSARSELVNKIILDNKSDYLLLDRFFDASMAAGLDFIDPMCWKARRSSKRCDETMTL